MQNYKKWSLDDIKYLRAKYPCKKAEKIAKKLGRSKDSIRHKADRLKVRAQYRASYQKSEITENLQRLTNFEKGYIAGFVDGEGWIGLHTGKMKYKGQTTIRLEPCVKVSNTNLEAFKFISKLIGAKHVSVDNVRQTTMNRKALWDLRMQRHKEICAFLKIFKDLLVIKKNQAKLLLKFCKSRLSKGRGIPYSDEEVQIYHELKELNKRGVEGYLKKT